MPEVFAVGFVCGTVTLGLVWALAEVRRRVRKPPRQAIYRQGKPPQVIVR